MKNGDKLSCLYRFLQSIIVLVWQIGEKFDVGPFEGPYVPESRRSWHPELNEKSLYQFMTHQAVFGRGPDIPLTINDKIHKEKTDFLTLQAWYDIWISPEPI